MPMTWPPVYVLKRHKRARQVSLKISPRRGLECVVPYRFNEAELPSILESKRQWIEKHLSTYQPVIDLLPEQVSLQAIGQCWQVNYVNATGKAKLLHRPNHELVVMGDLSDRKHCRQVLVNWIRRQAKEVLGPWLVTVSRETGLAFSDVSIRAQQTRWGSCSSRRAISLNYKLIFLRPEFARYVLIHELCHTVHLNHSKSFWHLVAEHNANWHAHDRGLRTAEKLVPSWVDDL